MRVVSEELAPYITDGKIEVEYTALPQFRQTLEDLLKEIGDHLTVGTAPRRGRPPGSKNGTRKKRATAKKTTATRRRRKRTTVGTVRRRRTTRRRRTSATV